MPRIVDEELEAVQIRFFKSDFAELKALFASNIGVNQGVRLIIRGYLRQVRATADARINEIEADALDEEAKAMIYLQDQM